MDGTIYIIVGCAVRWVNLFNGDPVTDWVFPSVLSGWAPTPQIDLETPWYFSGLQKCDELVRSSHANRAVRWLI